MRILDVVSRNFCLGSPNSSFGFECAHTTIQVGITQPEQCRHRGPVVEERRIADHHRHTSLIPYDDNEFTARLASEEVSDRREIRLEGLLFGQDQVSVVGAGATTAR